MYDVLIVEDDADLVETYTDLLETSHYSVISTAKANDAISLVMRAHPKLILLDLNLAGYSGTVVINVIRGYPRLKDTKIVVVTGHPELLKNYDSSRVDLVLKKPVSNEQLLDTVKQLAISP
jgi:CheY-like chemotaxis protein